MQDLGKLILRLAIGGMLFLHGIKKFDGVSGIEALLAAKDLPEFLAYGVYLGEVVAPAFLVLGLFGRVAGLVVAANMAFAIYLAHSDDVFTLNEYSGAWGVELPALFLFGALASALIGPGRLAVKLPARGA